MSMQQPPLRQQGRWGETIVRAFFEQIGWGVFETGDHDVGSDLYLSIRDEDLRESLLMLGVQVKTGDSFVDTVHEEQGQQGYWFYEDSKKHAHYWAEHPLPHIVVLQDQAAKRQYWAFATRSTIIDTGKGFKIFVPVNQVLASEFITRWTAEAERAQKRLSFEGAAWRFDINSVPPADRARFALLVPRLVSPHSNRSAGANLQWPEAIALALRGDQHRWVEAARRFEAVPGVDEASRANDPGWKLAAAVAQWVEDDRGDASHLSELDLTDAPRHIRVAHSVLVASALDEVGCFEAAADLLDGLLDASDKSANQGWLLIHRAVLAYEMDDLAVAQNLVAEATVLLAPLAAEVTVGAIRGATAWLALLLAEPLSTDVEKVVVAADNVASWWRTESIAHGLERATENSFRRWAHDPSAGIADVEIANNALSSAALVARLSGNRDQWRGTLARLAQVRAIGGDITRALEIAVLAGDQYLVERLIRAGRRSMPPQLLRAFIDDVNLVQTTRSNRNTVVTAVAGAGEFASPAQAHSLLLTLVRALAGDPEVASLPLARTRTMVVVAAIGSLAYAADLHIVDAVVHHVISDDADEVNAAALARALAAFEDIGLLEPHRDTLAAAALGALTPTWKRWLLARRSHTAPGVRALIRECILAGDLAAMPAVPVAQLDADEIAAVLRACAASMNQAAEDEAAGRFVLRVTNTVAIAVSTLATFPNSSDWSVVTDHLGDQRVTLERKSALCDRLLLDFDVIPSPVRDVLLGLLPSIEGSSRSPMPVPDGRNPESAVEALALALPVSLERREQALVALAASNTVDDRCQLARHFDRSRNVTALLLLADDDHPVVQRAVLAGLTHCLNESGSDAVRQFLQTAATTGGPPAALGIVTNLVVPANQVQDDALVDALKAHPSVLVRIRADRLARQLL